MAVNRGREAAVAGKVMQATDKGSRVTSSHIIIDAQHHHQQQQQCSSNNLGLLLSALSRADDRFFLPLLVINPFTA